MAEISILIPTYNGWLRIHQLLQNINQRTPKDIDYKVIVCDDSGKDEHRERVKDICSSFGAEYVYHQHNRGVPTAWNTLVKASDSKYIVLLNDDVLVAKDWLKFPLHCLRNNPQIGSWGLHCYFIQAGDVVPLLQGQDAKVIPLNVRYENGVLIRHERYPSMPSEDGGIPGRMMCPTGCAFAFSREIWTEVGGFDERYRAFYEETDFGVECAYRGYPSVQLPYPGNYHIWSQTFGSAPEIDAGAIIRNSKQKFLDKWRVRLPITINDAPDIHPYLMDKIPPLEIRWLNEHHLEVCSFI